MDVCTYEVMYVCIRIGVWAYICACVCSILFVHGRAYTFACVWTSIPRFDVPVWWVVFDELFVNQNTQHKTHAHVCEENPCRTHITKTRKTNNNKTPCIDRRCFVMTIVILDKQLASGIFTCGVYRKLMVDLLEAGTYKLECTHLFSAD
jgi:hypothetical protein